MVDNILGSMSPGRTQVIHANGAGHMQPHVAELIEGSRADILTAAAACFMERGYTSTSIDDVARRLGATKGRIYHHFASKADLFAAIFQAGMDMVYAAILPFRAETMAPLDRLRRMAAAHTAQIIRSQPFQRVVWEGVEMHLRGATTPGQRATLDRLLAYRNDYDRIFREAVAAAGDAGALRFDNLGIAVQLMFLTLNSPLFWYSRRAEQADVEIERLVGQVVGFAMRGLGSQRD